MVSDSPKEQECKFSFGPKVSNTNPSTHRSVDNTTFPLLVPNYFPPSFESGWLDYKVTQPQPDYLRDHRSSTWFTLNSEGYGRQPPVVKPHQLDQLTPNRCYVVDTGASADTASKAEMETFLQYVRNSHNYTFNTANGNVPISEGIRVQVADWHPPIDSFHMENAPPLMSVGLRTMLWGFSFLWLRGKHPCYISAKSRYIIVFETDHHVPLYRPSRQDDDSPFGTFDLWQNHFWDLCGIFVHPDGSVSIDVENPLQWQPIAWQAAATTPYFSHTSAAEADPEPTIGRLPREHGVVRNKHLASNQENYEFLAELEVTAE